MYNPREMSVEIDHGIAEAGYPVDNGEDAARDVAECFLAGVCVFDHRSLEEEGAVLVVQVEVDDVEPSAVSVVLWASVISEVVWYRLPDGSGAFLDFAAIVLDLQVRCAIGGNSIL